MLDAGRDYTEGNVEGKDNATAVGSDIKQDVRRSEASGNVVNLYTSPSAGVTAPVQQGGLMADAAQELWKAIAGLNQNIGELKAAGETQAKATEKLARSIDDQGERQRRNLEALQAQVSTLKRIEFALRGTRIVVPDADEDIVASLDKPVPVAVQTPNKWQTFLTPAILFLILLAIVYFGAAGGIFR